MRRKRVTLTNHDTQRLVTQGLEVELIMLVDMGQAADHQIEPLVFEFGQ